jgi:hypothetical protein
MPIFFELWQNWLEFKLNSKPISPRTQEDYTGTYHRYIEKAFGQVRVCDISRSFIYEQLSQIRKTNAEAVRKGLILLNMTLDHASLQGYIEINPSRLLKPAMFGASMGKPRERWLPKDELQLFL